MPKTHSAAAVEIGARLRTARLELGISLEDLAELAEINWTTIGRIERGVTSPAVESLVRIASALEVDPGSLITGIRADSYGRSTRQITARDLVRARRAGKL